MPHHAGPFDSYSRECMNCGRWWDEPGCVPDDKPAFKPAPEPWRDVVADLIREGRDEDAISMIMTEKPEILRWIYGLPHKK